MYIQSVMRTQHGQRARRGIPWSMVRCAVQYASHTGTPAPTAFVNHVIYSTHHASGTTYEWVAKVKRCVLHARLRRWCVVVVRTPGNQPMSCIQPMIQPLPYAVYVQIPYHVPEPVSWHSAFGGQSIADLSTRHWRSHRFPDGPVMEQLGTAVEFAGTSCGHPPDASHSGAQTLPSLRRHS